VAAGPVSRILSALRRDGHSSGPRIAAGLKRPTRRLWRTGPARAPGYAEASPGNPSLFGLAPCGVCPARCITAAAVRSYRTFSPLPEPCGSGGIFSVALSVERSRPYKRGGPPGRYPAHCPAEFGLSSVLRQRPSGPAANSIIIFDCLPPGRRSQVAGLRTLGPAVRLIARQGAQGKTSRASILGSEN